MSHLIKFDTIVKALTRSYLRIVTMQIVFPLDETSCWLDRSKESLLFSKSIDRQIDDAWAFDKSWQSSDISHAKQTRRVQSSSTC